MGVGPECHDTAAGRTAITLQVQAREKSIEKSPDKAMAPHPVMVAAQTGGRPLPQIILPLLGNLLENDGHKMYHDVDGSAVGSTPHEAKGRGVLLKLSAQPL